MTEVAVERDQTSIVVIVRVGNSVAMRATDAEFSAAMDHVHARMIARQRIERFAGAVRRVVINEKQIGVETEGHELRNDQRNVVALVVCRNEDQRLSDDSDPPARCLPSLSGATITTRFMR